MAEIISSSAAGSNPSDFTHVPEIVSKGWVVFAAGQMDGVRRLFVHELASGDIERVDELVMGQTPSIRET
ncbi:MAG: hypothetical protein HC888_10565 [Candidatus Competibacteraceae bacterium]|nr:hypothetical protein [Candidatus Competibacteraceae bacterium]